MLEMAGLWPHLMRNVPVRDVLVRDVPALDLYVHTSERTRKLRKRCHAPVCFFLFPFPFFSLILLFPFTSTSSSSFSFPST